MSSALKSIKRSNTAKAMKNSEFIQQLGVEPQAKMDNRAMEYLLRPESLQRLQLLSKMEVKQIKQMVQTCGPTARMKLLVALTDLEKTGEEEKHKAIPKVRSLLTSEEGVPTAEEVQQAAVEQGKRIAESIPGAMVLPDGRVIVPPKTSGQTPS